MKEINRKRRGHLFIDAAVKKSPELYSTEDIPVNEKKVTAHYFLGSFDYFVIEYDAETTTSFGLVVQNKRYADAELGYFNLSELEAVSVTANNIPLIFERDILWSARKIADIEPYDAELTAELQSFLKK